MGCSVIRTGEHTDSIIFTEHHAYTSHAVLCDVRNRLCLETYFAVISEQKMVEFLLKVLVRI